MCGFLRWMKRKEKAFHSKQISENREYSGGSQKIKYNKKAADKRLRLVTLLPVLFLAFCSLHKGLIVDVTAEATAE